MNLDLKAVRGSLMTAVHEDFARRIQEIQKEEALWEKHLAPVLSRLQGLPSWVDVQSISSYERSITLYLMASRQGSPLPREIAQEFGVKGMKSPSNSGFIYVIFEVGDVMVTASGYLPPSCRIVEEEEYVPGHVAKVRKVVCGEDAQEEAA